jgi:hypothetical protein
MASGLILGACAGGNPGSLNTTGTGTPSTTTAVPSTTSETLPPTTTTTIVAPTSTTSTTSAQTSTSNDSTQESQPTGSYETTIQIAETIESIAPGCADSIADGESDVSQYPAADLTQSGVAELFGIVDSGSCFGLFPGLFLFIYTTPQTRLHTTTTSAWFGCALGWTDHIQYVYGANWAVDAPYFRDFPGGELARLTGGIYNSQSCESFMAAYSELLDDDPPPLQTPSETLQALLGE